MATTNRYADLVKAVVGGAFYESKGTVIPYRYGATQVRLETDSPSTEFGLYVNEVFSGTTTSDSIGNVVFSRILPRGEVEIQLVNHVTGGKQNAWLTVREYALWFASYATVLELIDDNIQVVRDDMAITTVTLAGVEDSFGQYVGYYNDLDQDLSTYRSSLHELRLAYRNYGGRYGAIEKAASTITQVEPFGYARRKWGPNWILDQSFLENHRFKKRAHALTNTTGNITGLTLVSAEPDVLSGVPAGTIDYSNVTNMLLWSPGGIAGTPVLATEGALFLPGPPSTWPARVVGDLAEPYTVVAGVNDMLYLTIDEAIGGGYVTVQLVTNLPNPTAADVATDINAVLVADPRFGAPYAACASSYTYGVPNYVAIVSPVAAGSSVRLDNGPDNAAPAVFGIVRGDLRAPYDMLQGVTYVAAEGTIDINAGLATIEYRYNGTTSVRELRWHSPGVGVGAWVVLSDPQEYVLTDAGGATLTVYASPLDMEVLASPWPATDSFDFSLTYHRAYRNLAQVQGLNVLIDTSSLPAAVVTDNITLEDDSSFGYYEHPDNWFIESLPAPPLLTYVGEGTVVRDRVAPYDPSSSYAWWVLTVAGSISISGQAVKYPVTWPGHRGTSSPQKSYSGLYDYEGYDVIIGGWFKNVGAVLTRVRPKISWDGGVNYTLGSWTILPYDAGAYGKSTYVSDTFRIDDQIKYNATIYDDVIVGFDFDRLFPGIAVVCEALSAEVKYISSRYLTRSTIARSRHRQYQGQLEYVWSPDETSLRQKQYLGLFHKTVDKSTPYAGVNITVISADTSAGAGTLEYSYNAVGDVRMLRWSAQGTAWGPGVGWVTIIATGAYNLYASDGSYLTATVTREVLPLLTGTPPAATRSRTVTVSDTTVYQGLTREISPAHIALDIFDATEYDALGVAKNLFGSITEADFSACTLVNLDIQSANPFMYSYLSPSELSVTGEVLSISPATFQATLALSSDQDMLNAVLYGDGVPIPVTSLTGSLNWWFNSATQIQVDPVIYAASTDFTIDYNLLYRVTTPLFSVNPYELDYAWWAGYTLFDRRDSVRGDYLSTVPLFFNQDTGRAFLDRRSSMDTKTARLYYQTSSDSIEIAQRYWRFVNDLTVEVDTSQIVVGAQYYLTHTEKRTYERSHLDIGLRAVPSTLDLIPGVVISFISGEAVGYEGQIEYERTLGPVHKFRFVSALGGAGAQLTVVVNGTYTLFDDDGNYIMAVIDLAALPAAVGLYSQTFKIKRGVKFEHRSGIDAGGCLAASWKEIDNNDAVSSVNQAGVLYPIHQLRLTIGGIRDLTDFRVRSLVVKGLHIHGASPYVPGLTNCWR